MKTTLIPKWSMELSNNDITPEQALINALDAEWLTNESLAKTAVNIINNAECQNNNWDRIEDFKTKWDMVKFIMNTKMKKRSWIQVNVLSNHFPVPSQINN